MRSSVPIGAVALGLAVCLTFAAPLPAAGEPEPAADSAASEAVVREDTVPEAPAPEQPLAEEPPAEDPLAEDPGTESTADDFLTEYENLGAGDPLEPSNRVMFEVNEVVYQNVFDPLASAYAFVVPKPVRRSVLRFFENLGEPANFLNEMLQLNPVRAGKTSARFVINSTVGVVGLFDPAKRVGIVRNTTDFGETLGVYGIGEGWYLVVPVLGPSSVRDLVGDVVNSFFHPQTYFLAYAPQALLATGSGFSRYEASRKQLDALRDSSVDFYSAMRSAYLMQRQADVREARADSPVLGWGDGDVAAAPQEVRKR